MSDLLLRIWVSFVTRANDERGQSTAEYALVMIAAAAVAGLVVMWAHKTNLVSGQIKTEEKKDF